MDSQIFWRYADGLNDINAIFHFDWQQWCEYRLENCICIDFVDNLSVTFRNFAEQQQFRISVFGFMIVFDVFVTEIKEGPSFIQIATMCKIIM